MPGLVKAFLLFFALGIIAVGVQGVVRGKLPAGGNNSPPVSRDENPLLFWLVFCVYIGLGGWLGLYVLGIAPAKLG
jgi:hypothetical protein